MFRDKKLRECAGWKKITLLARELKSLFARCGWARAIAIAEATTIRTRTVTRGHSQYTPREARAVMKSHGAREELVMAAVAD